MTEFLRVGGVTIGVSFNDSRLNDRFEGPLQRFLTPPSNPPDLAIEVSVLDTEPPPPRALLFDSNELWRLFAEAEGFRIECRSEVFGAKAYKIVFVSADFRRAHIWVRPLPATLANPLEFPIDELLVNAFVTSHHAVELHACGIIDGDGTGLLFVGNSGDGKTTTARLWAGEAREIVSDDRVIVRQVEGIWWMYGTPWHGEAEICSPARAPLRRIFLLNNPMNPNSREAIRDARRENAAAPLAGAEAIARLFSCTFPPFHDPHGLGTILGTLEALTSSVPVTRLAFVNDASAVDLARRVSAEAVSA